MDPRLTCHDESDGREISTVEMLLLWSVRLASIPFLVLIVGLAALLYGAANLVRHLYHAAHHLVCPGRTWSVRVRAHDA